MREMKPKSLGSGFRVPVGRQLFSCISSNFIWFLSPFLDDIWEMETLHLETSDSNVEVDKNGPRNQLRRSSRVTSRAKSSSLTADNSTHENSNYDTSTDSESMDETILLKKMQSKLLKQRLKKKKLKASLDPNVLKALNKLLLKAKAKEAIKKLKMKQESQLAKYKFMMKLVKNAILHHEKSKNQNHDHSNSIEFDDSSDEMDESSLRTALDSVGGLNGLLDAMKDAQKDLVSQVSGQSGCKSTPSKKKSTPKKCDGTSSSSFSSNYGVIPDFFHMDFTGKKGLPDKCGLCGLEFPSDYMLVHHVKYQCATEADILGQTDIAGNFNCPSCDMVFVSKLRLMVHEVRKHSQAGRKYKCDQCEKSYKKCDTLIWHRRQAHMSLRMFKCDQCGNEFCYKSALDRHLKIHKGIKYTCNECNISYDSHSSYEYHMRKHKGLSYMCEVCGLRSWERRRIRKHYETNHPDHKITENALTLKPGADGSAAIADAAKKRSKLLQEKGGQLTDGSYVGAGTSRPRKPTRGRNIIKNNNSTGINEQLDDLNCATNSYSVKRTPEKVRHSINRSSSGSTTETVPALDLDGLEYTTYEFSHDSVAPATIEIVSDSSLHPLNSTLTSQTIYPSTSRQLSTVPTANYYTTSNGIHFTSGQLATVQMSMANATSSSNSFHVAQNVDNVTYATSQCKLCHALVSDLQTHYSSFHKLAPDVTVLFC